MGNLWKAKVAIPRWETEYGSEQRLFLVTKSFTAWFASFGEKRDVIWVATRGAAEPSKRVFFVMIAFSFFVE